LENGSEGRLIRGVRIANMSPETEYIVCIHFREPLYKLYSGSKVDAYTIEYRIQAKGKKAAKERALEKFRVSGQSSQVHWGRVVERVEVKAVR
jgi:hypothetical protein